MLHTTAINTSNTIRTQTQNANPAVWILVRVTGMLLLIA